MGEPSRSKQPPRLLKDLIGQLSDAASAVANRSLGVVGLATSPPHPPSHCLQACLHGNPERIQDCGCPWLVRAVGGKLDPTCLENGRCPRGFRVSGQAIRLNGSTGLLLAVEDTAPWSPEDQATGDQHEQALGKLEALSRVFEQVAQLLDENEGLADEVLRGYEQLNLLFDFTQQIASLTDVHAIEKVLVVRLGKLLAARSVLVVAPNGDTRRYEVSRGELIPQRGASVLDERLARQVEVLRRSRTVSVHSAETARVLLGPLVRLDDQTDMVLAIRPPEAAEFTSGDMLMIESILAFGGQIITNAEIHERLRRMSLESTRALVAAIDKKDHYTSGHSERVGHLARLTGQRLGVPRDELQILEMSGLLHDVGKIGVPEEILCKPGQLTTEEFAVIQKHPVMGYEILKPIASFTAVLDGVLYHHENADGSGYPKGLAGAAIPLFARIIHVADVFDALTSNRSYRAAFSLEQAQQIIAEEAGTKLDPEVAAVFLELLQESEISDFRSLLSYRAERPALDRPSPGQGSEELAAVFSSEKGEISNLKSQISEDSNDAEA
jgi:HD-GYP domain-containing protein (c-di-GMP phosphodiesterase class II)